eukprot:1337326-Lingulodinium_polyedra.AAC.1
MSDVRRKNEVIIKQCTVVEREEFHSAKQLEADRCVSNAVVFFLRPNVLESPKNRVVVTR